MKFNLKRFFKRKKKEFRIPSQKEYLGMDIRKEKKKGEGKNE